MAKKITKEEFLKRAVEIHGDKYHFNYDKVVFKKATDEVIITCEKHGDFVVAAISHVNKDRRKCPQCPNRSQMTTKEFVKKAIEVHGDRHDYTKTNYKGAHKDVLIRCKRHDCEFWMRPDSHIHQKQKCPQCGLAERLSPLRKTTEQFIIKAKAKWEERYDYSITEYKNKITKLKYKCNQHGIIEQLPKLHIRSGCPYCNGRGISKHTPQTFVEKARARHGDKYDYSKVDLSGIHDKITIVCPLHGEFVQAAYIHFICGCPKCDIEKTSSRAEKDALEFIKANYAGMVIGPDRSVLDGKEIDIYMPELKTGIEYHGMYWHIESQYGIKKHHNKANLAKEKGIRLIQVYEDEWINSREIVESRIKGLLGKHDKIHARKTKIREVSKTKEREFITKTHIQGYRNSEVAIGLFLADELVACMTFCRSRFDKKINWELLRFSSKLNTRVVGGASKLLSHFLADHKGSLISYSDRRWSNGDMYEKLGFKYAGTSNPGYKYYNLSDKTLHSRIKFQKHRLSKLPVFDANLTEYENMKMNGFDRIWDAGVDRWIIE